MSKKRKAKARPAKTAIGRISAARLNDFDAEILSWAKRLQHQSELKRIWPNWYEQTLAFCVRPNTENAAYFVKAYLVFATERLEFQRLPPMSRRICLRTIARLEERLVLFGGTRHA